MRRFDGITLEYDPAPVGHTVELCLRVNTMTTEECKAQVAAAAKQLMRDYPAIFVVSSWLVNEELIDI